VAVYGKQADIDANPDANVALYVPGATNLTANDTFLGGTGTGISEDQVEALGAERVAGYTAQDTQNAYNAYKKKIAASATPPVVNQPSTPPVAIQSSLLQPQTFDPTAMFSEMQSIFTNQLNSLMQSINDQNKYNTSKVINPVATIGSGAKQPKTISPYKTAGAKRADGSADAISRYLAKDMWANKI